MTKTATAIAVSSFFIGIPFMASKVQSSRVQGSKVDGLVKSPISNFIAYNFLILLHLNFIFCEFCLLCEIRSLFLWGAFLRLYRP